MTAGVNSLRQPMHDNAGQNLSLNDQFCLGLRCENHVEELLAQNKCSEAIAYAKSITCDTSKNRAILAIVRACKLEDRIIALIDVISISFIRDSANKEVAEKYFAKGCYTQAYRRIQKCQDLTIKNSFCNEAIPKLLVVKQMKVAENFFKLLSNDNLRSSNLTLLLVELLKENNRNKASLLLSTVAESSTKDTACHEAALLLFENSYQASMWLLEAIENPISKQQAYKELALCLAKISDTSIQANFIASVIKQFGQTMIYSILRYLISKNSPELAGLFAAALPQDQRLQLFVDDLIEQRKIYAAMCICWRCKIIQIDSKQCSTYIDQLIAKRKSSEILNLLPKIQDCVLKVEIATCLTILDHFIKTKSMSQLKTALSLIPIPDTMKIEVFGSRIDNLVEYNEFQTAWLLTKQLPEPEKSKRQFTVVQALVACDNLLTAQDATMRIQIPYYKEQAFTLTTAALDAAMIVDTYHTLDGLRET